LLEGWYLASKDYLDIFLTGGLMRCGRVKTNGGQYGRENEFDGHDEFADTAASDYGVAPRLVFSPWLNGARAGAEEEVSRTAESIHMEPVFKASRKRVYEALTETKQFDKVIHLSAAMKSGMPPDAKPTEIQP